MAGIREQPVPERLESGAGGRGDGGMAAVDAARCVSRSIISSATSSWNITATAGVKGVWPLPANSRALGEVEVRARHVGRLVRRPCAVRQHDHRDARGRHPCLLRCRDDHVEAPRVHLERHAAETRDAVDEDQRVGRGLVDRGGDVGQGVHHARRRLVVGDEHGPEARRTRSASATTAGSAAWPHSTSSFVTSAP